MSESAETKRNVSGWFMPQPQLPANTVGIDVPTDAGGTEFTTKVVTVRPGDLPLPVLVHPSDHEAESGVGQTLEQARELVMAQREGGITCPCCDQLVKLYKRKLNTNMGQFLISLVLRYNQKGQDWVRYSECKFTGRDYPYISLWGLAETQPNTDETKKNSGMWRPTQKGIDFAYGRITVPSHVHVYNNQVVGWSDTPVGIRDVLNRPFSYSELVG